MLTPERRIAELRAKATQARRLADAATDPVVAENLRRYAVELDVEAGSLDPRIIASRAATSQTSRQLGEDRRRELDDGGREPGTEP
jgi:hypothetical protein